MKIGCKQELAARKNTARLPVNPDLFIKQKGTYIIYGQNIKKENKRILSINNMLRLFKRKRIIREEY